MDSTVLQIPGNLYTGMVAAFAAGLVSSFSPCTLAAVPLVIGYVGGYAGKDTRRACSYAAAFCGGATVTFTLMGAIAAAIGNLMMRTGNWLFPLVGAALLLAGLQLLGVVNVAPAVCRLPRDRRGPLGAFLLGMLGGAMSSPCATPMLAAILAVVAARGHVVTGILWLLTYAVGHSALLLAVGASTGLAQALMSSEACQRWARRFRAALGCSLIVVALYSFYLWF